MYVTAPFQRLLPSSLPASITELVMPQHYPLELLIQLVTTDSGLPPNLHRLQFSAQLQGKVEQHLPASVITRLSWW